MSKTFEGGLKTRFKIQVCSVKEFYLISKRINLDNAAAILCSSYPIDAEKARVVRNKLCLNFYDTTNVKHPYVFSITIATQIKKFVDALDGTTDVLYICCDSGESRSSALAAAVKRYYGDDDMDIWSNPHYHPNPLVYKLQCKVFGKYVSRFRLYKNLKVNKQAFCSSINKK